MRTIIPILVLTLARPVVAQAPPRVQGAHAIELTVGMLTAIRATSDVTVGAATVRSEAAGAVVSVGYGYWVTEDWGVQVSVGAASANATVSASVTSASVESAVVVPLLFGVKYAPAALAGGGRLRPYGAFSVGPYIGQASSVRAGATTIIESHSETAIGARAVIGMDVSLGRRLTLGAAVGYRPVADFSAPIGGRTNYSSPDVSLSVAFRLGGGTR